MSAGAGATHSRMSELTTVTRSAQSGSESTRFWRQITAFAFFSTAYTRIGTPAPTDAARDAATSGPRPAPTTLTITGDAAVAGALCLSPRARAPPSRYRVYLTGFFPNGSLVLVPRAFRSRCRGACA